MEEHDKKELAAAPPAYGPFTRWPEQTRRREHFAGMTRRRGVGSGPTCLWPFHTLARDAEYQPVAAGRVPLPDGQEAVAKRQGFRQVRWAAASLCLSPAHRRRRQQVRHASQHRRGEGNGNNAGKRGQRGATGQDDDACRNPSARRRTRAPGAQGGKCAGRRQEVAQD